MLISLIVAMDQNRGIGQNNRIPWRLAADMKNFKTLTMGHHLIVGRKTAESIGRPLPGRAGVLITRTEGYTLPGWQTVHTLKDALALAEAQNETEAFIGGGAEIYAQSLPFANRIYLTRVHTTAPADTFFPAFDETLWVSQESWEQTADEKNEFAFTFEVLIRRCA
ncbi:MAG: dihydrofolate reductase [Anaerolineales bacterium]